MQDELHSMVSREFVMPLSNFIWSSSLMIGGLIFYSYKMLKPSIEEMKQHGLIKKK
jgi:hypothetical protein